jgi:DNA polymerase/3'-5' exonuclease PolX
MHDDFHPEYAGTIAKAICYDLRDAVERIEIAGALRRKQQRVRGVSIIYVGKYEKIYEKEDQGDLFGGFSGKRKLLGEVYRVEEKLPKLDWYLQYRKDEHGEFVSSIKGPLKFKAMINPQTGVPVDLFPVASEMEWGVALLLKTGPTSFNERIVEAARKKGYRCDGNRFFRMNDNSWTPCSTEQAFFDLCGIPWVDPEGRK